MYLATSSNARRVEVHSLEFEMQIRGAGRGEGGGITYGHTLIVIILDIQL